MLYAGTLLSINCFVRVNRLIVDTAVQVMINYLRDTMYSSENGIRVDDSTYFRSVNYSPLSTTDYARPTFIVIIEPESPSEFIMSIPIIKSDDSRLNVTGMLY